MSNCLNQTAMVDVYILQRRGHWSYPWKYCLSLFALPPIHRKQDIKTGRNCLRGNIEATQRDGSTYTIICSRNLLGGCSLVVLLPPTPRPFFFSFTSKLFFKTSLVSLLLPRGLPPAFFVRTLSARRLLPPSSLPTRFSHRSVSIYSLFLVGTDCVVGKRILKAR